MVHSCGIDFGTTNSAAAIAGENLKPKLVPLEQNNYTIPSAVFFNTRKESVHYGFEAARLYLSGEDGRYMRSLKRILGTELMGYHTQIGKNVWKFDKIIGLYLKNIKEKIDYFAKDDVTRVVMGRPVHFRNDDAPGDVRAQNELESIAKTVGFKHIEFQYEPIAAAFAHEEKLTSEKLALVVDIGGGTSDFTVIRLGPALKNKANRADDILADAGLMVGGNDFDQNFSLASFMPLLGRGTTYGSKNLTVPSSIYFELSEWSKINGAYANKNIREAEEILSLSHCPRTYGRLLETLHGNYGHRLLNIVEESKINLTQETSTTTLLDFLSDKPELVISKEAFEKSILKSVQKINGVLKDCLKASLIKPHQIDLVIMTGGSTGIDLIGRQIKVMFPGALIADTDKLSSVGLGLAYDAKRRFAG